MFEAIFFDLDGTLIDTEPVAARAVRESFEKWGIRITSEDSQYVTGRTWANALDYLFKRYPLPFSAEEGFARITGRYHDLLEAELPIVPGSAEAVCRLARSYRLALVSGSMRSEILWALEKLKILSHFEVILGMEDYPRSKPEPDGYLKAAGLMNVTPDRGLVFEDSTAGIASALTAGMRVVAITSTNHFNQDTSRAHHRIPDLQDIGPDWVSGLRL